MNKKLNASCSVCGRRYHLCMDCSKITGFTPWRAVADTKNCYRIFLTIRDYSNGYINKEAASSRLNGCDLTGLSSFSPEIRRAIRDISSG